MPLTSSRQPAAPLLRRLAILGAGALGSELCRLLIQASLPEVLVIDPDCVQPHNIPLSPLFQAAGSGALAQPKAHVVCAAARQHGLPWTALTQEAADVSYGLLRRCDLLISCTDSALSRLEIALAARTLGLPMLDGAVQSDALPAGRVSWFHPQSACYGCGLRDTRRVELLRFAQDRSLGCMPGPTVSPQSGAPRTIQETALALFRVLQQPPQDRSFALRLTVGSTGAAEERVELLQSLACPFHHLPNPAQLQPLPHRIPLASSLQPGTVLQLDWPVCTAARCTACGHHAEPMRRLALVRRTLCCPACGRAGVLEPLAATGRIASADALARCTPEQLGLPLGHLFHVRSAILP